MIGNLQNRIKWLFGGSEALPAQTASVGDDALHAAPLREVRFGEVGVLMARRADGSIRVSADRPLQAHEPNLLARFWAWGDEATERPWLARRAGPERRWTVLSYQEGRSQVSAVARWLGAQRIAEGRSILILSESSVAHAVWMFGAIAAGVPVCSVSVNYSLASRDFERLREAVALVNPAVVFAEQGGLFADAIAAAAPKDAVVVSAEPVACGRDVVLVDEVLARPAVEAVGEWVEALDPRRPARYLLTSGSTGVPKAVVHTQAMMTANTTLNVQAMGETFAWDQRVLDWMPWSHIGGSCLLTNVSYLGGALYIDDGRPTPDRFAETLRNLREIPLRCYSNVPAGYAMLIEALEADAELRAVFFRDLRAMLFGGAGLPQALHDRFQRACIATTGARFAFVSGYGSTETASAVSVTYWPADKPGIGLPAPGVSFKLVPVDDAFEVRIKAPSVTPGYLNDADRTTEAFDEEGFLRMADLARFHDPDRVEEGLQFAGRMSEQFKLSNATFVAAGKVREQVLAAAPGLFQDLVVCGEGRDALGILAWPRRERVAPDKAAYLDQVRDALRRHNARWPGQSTRIRRLVLLSEPPSVEAHEISDKGSINRLNVLRRRPSEVERLFATPADHGVVTVD